MTGKPQGQGEENVRERLRSDSDYLRSIEEGRMSDERVRAAHCADARPLLDELRAIEMRLDSLWDLVNTRQPYPAAIPVLMKYLDRMALIKNREAIVRALTVRESKGVADIALVEFLSGLKPAATFEEHQLVWLIGRALAFAASARTLPRIAALTVDSRYANAREGMLVALRRWRDPLAVDAIARLLDSPEARGLALKAAGVLRPESLLPKVLELSRVSNGAERDLALKAAQRIQERGWDDSKAKKPTS